MTRTTLKGLLTLALPALLFGSMATMARAEMLKIDFNSLTQDAGPHPEAGYQAYDAGHEVPGDFVTRSYPAFGTTVSLTPTWPDTTADTVQQMIDRTTSGPLVADFDANYVGNKLDLVTDFIGIDARAANGGNGPGAPTTMDLTLAGFPAGQYYYRAYHHDTEYVNAPFAITLSDADGTVPIGNFEMTASSEAGTNPNPVNPGPGNDPDVLTSTVVFPFRSSGAPVIIEYQVTEGPNVHESILGVNGIEISDQPILPPTPLLEIDRATGAMTFTNVTADPIPMLGYSIQSAAGALDPAKWQPIAGNSDAPPSGDGSVDPDDPWTQLTAATSRGDLSEAELVGGDGATIASGQSIVFSQPGASPWIQSPTEDVRMAILQADGAVQDSVRVHFVGNGDQPHIAGDFNFDGAIDSGDYPIFLAGLQADLSSLSLAEAYQMGDMNGDLASNHADVLLFKAAFNAANGVGAFDAMITAVPEPGSLVLLVLGGAMLICLQYGRIARLKPECAISLTDVLSSHRRSARRRASITQSRAMRFWLATLTTMALAGIAGYTDAETLKIDFNSTTQDNGPHPEAGYRTYDAGHEVATDFITRDYDVFGTTVSLTPAWPDTTDNRVQQMIDRGTNGPPIGGNDANYDGTKLDLVTDFIGIDARAGNGGNGLDVPTTMDLTLAGLPAGEYSYRAYHHDTENVNAPFTITLTDADGTVPIGNFEMTASSPAATNPNPINPGPGNDPDVLPSTVIFPFRSNGSPVVIEYQITEGPNVHESILGVNGIEISDQSGNPDVLALEVNTDTGIVQILNPTGLDKEINFYEILSPSGSLDVAGWDSLDDQKLDASGDGGPLDGWDEAGGSRAEVLSELNFLGSSVLADQGALSLGSAFKQATGQEDLEFNFSLSDGSLLPGIVEYVEGGVILGDVNLDTVVNGLDVDPFVGVLLNGPFQAEADMNTDGVVNGLDVDPFVAAVVGGGVQAVPEPSTLALVGLAGLAMILRISRGGRLMKRSSYLSLLIAGLLVAIVGTVTRADSTNDRAYLFGDNTGVSAQNENATAGQKIGSGAGGVTFDRVSESNNPGSDNDAQNLSPSATAGPTYVSVGQGPFLRTAADGDPTPPAAGDLGAQFSGSGEYLRGARLGLPSSAAGSIGYGDVVGGAVWNPNDYTGISNRGYQLWVYPTSNAAAQSVVMDTNQHGVRISAAGNWSMHYPGGTDVESTSPVATDQWSHVMLVRPFGAAGGGRLYVDGIVVAANGVGYTGDDNASLVLGSNTDQDADGNFTGGTEEFFSGLMDNLEMFVLGTSTGDNPEDFGTFDPQTDNQFIAGAMAGVPDGDVDMDGTLDPVADVDAFVAGWLNLNEVNGMQVGDLGSRAAGDLNFDGITDLSDAFVLHEALSAAGGGLDFSALTAAVPEPSTLVLLSLAAVLGLLWRRR